MDGQMALSMDEQTLAPAMVWETVSAESQQAVTIELARLLAKLMEAERDE